MYNSFIIKGWDGSDNTLSKPVGTLPYYRKRQPTEPTGKISCPATAGNGRLRVPVSLPEPGTLSSRSGGVTAAGSCLSPVSRDAFPLGVGGRLFPVSPGPTCRPADGRVKHRERIAAA